MAPFRVAFPLGLLLATLAWGAPVQAAGASPPPLPSNPPMPPGTSCLAAAVGGLDPAAIVACAPCHSDQPLPLPFLESAVECAANCFCDPPGPAVMLLLFLADYGVQAGSWGLDYGQQVVAWATESLPSPPPPVPGP